MSQNFIFYLCSLVCLLLIHYLLSFSFATIERFLEVDPDKGKKFDSPAKSLGLAFKVTPNRFALVGLAGRGGAGVGGACVCETRRVCLCVCVCVCVCRAEGAYFMKL